MEYEKTAPPMELTSQPITNQPQPPYPTSTPYPMGTAPYPVGPTPYPVESTPYPPPGGEPTGLPPPYFPEQETGHVPTATTTTVITVIPVALGHESAHMVCPHCHAEISTKVKYEVGSTAHLVACILCCFVCWPLAWLPYATDSCKNATHSCPNCDAYLGEHRR